MRTNWSLIRSITMRSASRTFGVVATPTVTMKFWLCSTWLCLRLCISAEGAISGSDVRKTAVPGAVIGWDFFIIAIRLSSVTVPSRALRCTWRVPRTHVHISTQITAAITMGT